MITFVELAERIEQLEKRVQILESQISGDSPNQKKANNDLNQFNLTESNIEENIDVFDNSYFYDTDFSKNDLPDNSVDDFTFCEVFGGIEFPHTMVLLIMILLLFPDCFIISQWLV